MLLNSYGQPTLYRETKQHSKIDQLRNAPMIMCHDDALFGRSLPKDWCGTLYTTKSIIDNLSKVDYKVSDASYCTRAMLAGLIYNVELSGNNLAKLSMFSLADNLMYIIRDDYVTTFLTDDFTLNDLNAFQRNKLIRNYIAQGIDVLYFNDAVYKEQLNASQYPSKFVLKCLATLVKPRLLKGHLDNTLPQSLLNCCKKIY